MHKFCGNAEENNSVVPGWPSQSRRHLGKSQRVSRASLSGVRALQAEKRMNKSTSTSNCSAGCYCFSFQMTQVRNPGRDKCLGGCPLQGWSSQLSPAASRNFTTAESGWLNYKGRTSWGAKYLQTLSWKWDNGLKITAGFPDCLET